MKRLENRLLRAMMYLLCVMPVCAFLFRLLMDDGFWYGPIWLCAQTVLAALLALLPAYIGNYREYEVLTIEGGAGSDPNPDREVKHTMMHEGKRFPLRMTADVAFLALNFVLALFLPGPVLAGRHFLYRLGFLLMMSLLLALAMPGMSAAQCLWTDLPGMLLGAVGYLGAAIYLHFTITDVSRVKPLITVCAVLFLFFGGVTLNRQSIRASMSAHAGEANRAPREIVRRNRRIVLSFATLVTVVSLVEPIRAAANWCLARVGAFFRWISALLSRGGDATETMPELGGMAIPAGETAAQVAETAESSPFADILTYAFLGLVALGFVWMLFDRIRALINRLSEWLEKFAGSVNEGFYDEREQLMSADEVREDMKKRLRERMKQLFTRETPWEKLDGRGRARRLLRDFYKKRMRKTSNLRTRTAREAIFTGDAARADREAFAAFYEEARYSEHAVDAARADQFKKDLKL